MKDLELHAVDVSRPHLLAALGVHPEEVRPKVEQNAQAEQVGRQAPGHGENVGVDREAGTDHGDEAGEDVARAVGYSVVLLRDLQGWCGHHLLTAQAHVGVAGGRGRQGEEAPVQ